MSKSKRIVEECVCDCVMSEEFMELWKESQYLAVSACGIGIEIEDFDYFRNGTVYITGKRNA